MFYELVAKKHSQNSQKNICNVVLSLVNLQALEILG